MDYVWIIEVLHRRTWDALGTRFYYTRADARAEVDRLEGSGIQYRIRKYVREARSMNEALGT